jgi:hypothetical protein
MTSSRMFAVAAALVIAAGMIGTAGAQDQAPQQSPSYRSMMGNGDGRGIMGYGFIGPGMMGYGFMGPGMMGPGGIGYGMMGWNGSGQWMCSAMADHVEGRLGYLKAELKITEAQEPLWKNYAAAARENAKTMFANCTTMTSRRGASALNLPDRLDQHEQLMAAQLEAMRAMNKALKPLYAALSDSQKQDADQLFWGPMGMM